MKTFIADFGKFIKNTQWDFVAYTMASILWCIGIPYSKVPITDIALWFMLAATYIKPNKDKMQYEVEQAGRDVRDTQHKATLQMLSIVLAELHDIKDELNKEVKVPDKNFWTADTVEQFNNHKP